MQLWLLLIIVFAFLLSAEMDRCNGCDATFDGARGLKTHRRTCKGRDAALHKAAQNAQEFVRRVEAAKIPRVDVQDVAEDRQALREQLNKVSAVAFALSEM